MKALAIAGANLRRFIRDRSNVFFVFIMPIGIVILIGAQFGGDFATLLGVHMEGDGPITTSLVSALDESEQIRTVSYDSEDELLLAVERGDVSAGLSSNEDIDAAISSGQRVQIGFISRPDGVGPQLQAIVSSALAEVTEVESAARFAESLGVARTAAIDVASVAQSQVPDIEVRTVTTGDSLFPADMGQFDLGASTQLVLFMFLTGVTGSAALIQSRQYGVTTRMLGTPTSVGTVISGEAIGRFGIVLVQGLYIIAVTLLAFGVDWGNPLGVTAVMLAYALVGAGAAMMFGTFFRNEQQAGGVSILAGIGLGAIGGSMLPLELFSPTMRTISQFTPHYWANDAFADLVRRDATLVDVLPQTGVLVAYGAVLLALSAWRMRHVISNP